MNVVSRPESPARTLPLIAWILVCDDENKNTTVLGSSRTARHTLLADYSVLSTFKGHVIVKNKSVWLAGQRSNLMSCAFDAPARIALASRLSPLVCWIDVASGCQYGLAIVE